MTAPLGYYDQSLPPSLWAQPAQPVAAAARRASASAVTYTVAAGAPGVYSPDVKAADRPRNITELRDTVAPDGLDPWPAGDYVLVGENGKRAHWTGEDWRTGESPGYATTDTAEDADEAPEADPGTVPAGTVP